MAMNMRCETCSFIRPIKYKSENYEMKLLELEVRISEWRLRTDETRPVVVT
jgi:hypothetical protein